MRINKRVSPSEFDSIVGNNSTFNGCIECEGSVRIDGKQEGDIKASGNVLIGKQGTVTGNIEGQSIQVAGTINGNIKASEILRILSTAKLVGDIEVKNFVADEGAVFQGNCKMLDSDGIDENNNSDKE